MKKQTRKTKTQNTKMAVAMTRAVVVHNRRQRFWGIVALAGLFFCGLFVGMAINKPTNTICRGSAVVAQAESEMVAISEAQSVCAEIERLLARHLPVASDDVDDRIERAKIYASMAERGCPENANAYVELARQELDIARAIEDDEFDHEETIEVVETYKRLNMQAAAEEIFEKAKKLTNPAIDFILQVEKIINE